MEESVSDLGGSSIKEFIEGRLEEINNLEDVVRDSVQTGSIEDTRELAQQLSQSVSQFAEGVSEMLERAQAEEDQLQEDTQ